MYNELQLRSDKTGNPMTSIVRQALNEYVYGKDVKEWSLGLNVSVLAVNPVDGMTAVDFVGR